MNPTQEKTQLLVSKIQPLELESAELSASYFYQSLPFAVVDSIFSIGVRYGQVQNTIIHMGKELGWKIFRDDESTLPRPDDQKSMDDFHHELIFKYNAAIFYNKGFLNPRAREADRVQKAEAVRRITEIFVKNGIQYFQDFISHPESEELEEEIHAAIPPIRSGVTYSYLRMLAGDEFAVKPDRMTLRFLSDISKGNTKPKEAISIIKSASRDLRKLENFRHVTPRFLNHQIWVWQSLKSKNKTLNTTITRSGIEFPTNINETLDYDKIFLIFWEEIRKGGETHNHLKYEIDFDERLVIQSKNSKRHLEHEHRYRVKKSTARKYIEQVSDINFRRNHGWFCAVYENIKTEIQHQIETPGELLI